MIGVVADDLTGAAELGAVGLRYGLTAQVAIESQSRGEAQVVCMDTDSRSCGPEEAGRRAAAAAGALTEAGAEWIYKKVDSVLRGPVLAELQAVMARLQTGRTLLVPANPGLGRIIRGGCYFVRGQPIHKTNFRYDPEFPRLTDSVRDLLGNSDSLQIQVCTPGERLPQAGLIIGEAQSAEDLHRWSIRWDSSTLAAGGAEFFAALLATKSYSRAQPQTKYPSSGNDGPELFVCGSASKACEDFVSRERQKGVPIFELPVEWLEAAVVSGAKRERLADKVSAALQRSPRAVLKLGLERGSAPEMAKRLMDELVKVAGVVLRRGAVRQVFVEGGATAAKLVRDLGWQRLNVLRELAPGVVTLGAADGGECVMTMKPGSYSWPETEGNKVAHGT